MTFLSRAPRAGVRARGDSRGRGPATRRGLQIGPRIKIGGSVGKALGQVQKFVPDFRSLVGGAIAGPAGAIGTSAANGTLGSDLKKGATNAGIIMGGQAALGGGGSALDKLRALIMGGGSDNTGNFGLAGDLAGKLFGGGDGAGGGGGSSLIDKGLLAASIASNAADRQRQTGLQNQAIDYAKQPYDAKAPLRARALAQLENDSGPDLSSIFSNPGSVYDRQRRGMPSLTSREPAAAMVTQGQALSGALTDRAPATPRRMVANV